MHINRPIRTPVYNLSASDEYIVAAESLLRKRKKKREVNPSPFASTPHTDASEIVALQRLALALQKEQRDLQTRLLETRSRLDRLALRINRLSPDAN